MNTAYLTKSTFVLIDYTQAGHCVFEGSLKLSSLLKMREEVTSRTVKSNALNEAPLPRAGDRDRTHGVERQNG